MKDQIITCGIKRQIGILSHSTNGWKKDLNFVSWGGAEAMKRAIFKVKRNRVLIPD